MEEKLTIQNSPEQRLLEKAGPLCLCPRWPGSSDDLSVLVMDIANVDSVLVLGTYPAFESCSISCKLPDALRREVLSLTSFLDVDTEAYNC